MFPGLENIKNYLADIIESLSDGIFITDSERIVKENEIVRPKIVGTIFAI